MIRHPVQVALATFATATLLHAGFLARLAPRPSGKRAILLAPPGVEVIG
jgi:hypothetical protein